MLKIPNRLLYCFMMLLTNPQKYQILQDLTFFVWIYRSPATKEVFSWDVYVICWRFYLKVLVFWINLKLISAHSSFHAKCNGLKYCATQYIYMYNVCLEKGSDQLLWHYIHYLSIPLYTIRFSKQTLYFSLIFVNSNLYVYYFLNFPSFCLFILSILKNGCQLFCLSVCLFVCLSVCLIVWLSVCLFVCLSVNWQTLHENP